MGADTGVPSSLASSTRRMSAGTGALSRRVAAPSILVCGSKGARTREDRIPLCLGWVPARSEPAGGSSGHDGGDPSGRGGSHPRDAGSVAELEDFYDAEAQTLFRRLWLVTGNRSEAEELMQDAFLKVWERWERVEAMDDPVGYLYRTAMNLFRKRYRRAVMAVRRTIGLAPSRDDFADADDRETVRRMLSTIPPRQRAALVLTELLGFSPDEAGHALGVQASTVRSLSRHGRESFRRAMEVDDA